jgi:chemotaxis protein CheD
MSDKSIIIERKQIVGIAQWAVSNDPGVTLATYGLGSCLAVAVHDPVARAGGLIHLMLPDSSFDTGKAAGHPAMFVDTGIPALFRAAYKLGAEKHRMIIYAAGGAEILDDSGGFNVGARNHAALRALLAQHDLRLQAEHVGGQDGRTLCLNVATGEVRVKLSGQPGEISLCKTSTPTSIA